MNKTGNVLMSTVLLLQKMSVNRRTVVNCNTKQSRNRDREDLKVRADVRRQAL